MSSNVGTYIQQSNTHNNSHTQWEKESERGEGDVARLANALLWFDVDAMAGWVAPLVRVANTSHDVFSSTCPFTPQS